VGTKAAFQFPTRSSRPSISAATKNAENIVLIGHPTTIQEYKEHFEKLLKNAVRAQAPESKKTSNKISQKAIDAILHARG